MRTAVITVAHGRHQHLRRQLDGLAAGSHLPDLHVVVALADPDVPGIVAGDARRHVVAHDADPAALPLGQARNVGAAAALERGAELLVFLDVDCIPGRDLIGRYLDVAGRPQHGDALLCGPVTYLPPPGPHGYDLSALEVRPHPARPAPDDGDVLAGTDYTLFWSLSFAATARTWQRIGGFCELYRGYGGEDTDFGQCAAEAEVGLRWVGGAHAFHQHHPVSNPPVQHLDDIVANAAVFHRRWGWWPMGGWLEAFEARGLIERDAEGRPIRLSAPASAKSS
ncbi:glycosyltransferase family 2 protein [Mycolicibacterium mengxianglii]|uniref:glycosyltransferase family 2 protein n=1 Tax=Mycolicibacterium mengxianglii TaxID=2736649 RepID=UPI0018D00A08|nr:galactosyltransferase-related protein [Mycolicibacterium mengxianglii]